MKLMDKQKQELTSNFDISQGYMQHSTTWLNEFVGSDVVIDRGGEHNGRGGDQIHARGPNS